MRKLVYPLVAVLCFYLSSNCHAQTDQEMALAKAQYKEFLSWYPSIDKSLKKDLKAVENAQTKAEFDATTYTEYKKELQEQYKKNVNPIINLNNKYPVVRGKGNTDLQHMREKAESKYNALVKLVNKIETKLSTLR